MKAMMTGFIAMVVITIGAYFALDAMGFSAAEVHSGPNVRLD